MLALVMSTLIFISDVQLNHWDAYPDSVATLLSAQVGGGTVYDCGDLVENGAMTEELEYARYRELFPFSEAVPGNHDHYDGLVGWNWPRVVDTWVAGIHLVGFDSNLWQEQESLDWLRSVITDGAPTVVYMHHPCFSNNSRVGDIAQFINREIQPILEECGINLLISGHGHAYERHLVGGLTCLVIGGGGAHLDTVEPGGSLVASASEHHWLEITPHADGISCVVRRLDGTTIDAFQILGTVAAKTTTWGDLSAMYR